jgi:hypothetical protein
MKKHTLAWAACTLMLAWTTPAHAATGADFIEAVRGFVQTGLAGADSSFATLRGAEIKAPPGEHYEVKSPFGEFLPDCHVSGYLPPAVQNGLWVLSCSTPGLSAANVDQLRGLVYEGAIRALPACFTRTLNPLVLSGEDFRWDCNAGAHGLSVDVTSRRTENGHTSFLLEVYEYLTPRPQLAPLPAPSATPMVIHLLQQDPRSAVDMGSVQVPYVDYATLELAEHLAIAKGSKDVPKVLEVVKGGNEMPAYNPYWHYAGKDTSGGMPAISVWVCGNLSPQEQSMALTEGTLMGLLDSGLGGAVLQKAYADAMAADTALGASAADPFLNRRKLVMSMAKYFR